MSTGRDGFSTGWRSSFGTDGLTSFVVVLPKQPLRDTAKTASRVALKVLHFLMDKPLEIPPETIRELLHADAENGHLYFKVRSAKWFAERAMPAEASARSWNSKYAGTLALNSMSDTGYKFGNLLGKPLKAHRVMWCHYYGEWPSGDLDHINRNKTDNRIENLRETSSHLNSSNTKRDPGAHSPYRGVTWIKRKRFPGKWKATIKHKMKTINLGLFDAELDAARAYNEAAKQLKGDYAVLNDLQEDC